MKTLFQKILLFGLFFLWSRFFVLDYQVSQWVKQADQLLAARQPEAAEDLFRQAEKAEPWRLSDWNGLAQVYMMLGKTDSVIRIFEELEKKVLLESGKWSILAGAYQRTGQVEHAESAMLAANDFAATPDEKMTSLLNLVKFYRSQAQFQKALIYQQQITRLANSPSESHINEVLLLTVHDPEAGLSEWHGLTAKPDWLAEWGKALTQAISEKDETKRWVQIGRAYGAAGIWDLAEYSFTRSVQLSPDYAEAWGLLAEARQQQEKDGRTQIKTALELAPQSPAIRLIGALFYRRQFDYKNAITLLQQNIDNQPDEVIWYLEMGRTLADAGRLEEAILAYQQAVQLTPGKSNVYQRLARFCVQYEYRLEDVGLPAALKAVELSPDSAEADDALGQVYFALGKYDQADEGFRKALDNNSRYSPAWLHLGQMLLAEQDYSKAKESLQNAAAFGTNTPEGTLALRLLKQFFQITVDQIFK